MWATHGSLFSIVNLHLWVGLNTKNLMLLSLNAFVPHTSSSLRWPFLCACVAFFFCFPSLPCLFGYYRKLMCSPHKAGPLGNLPCSCSQGGSSTEMCLAERALRSKMSSQIPIQTSLVQSCRVFFSFLLYFKHEKSMQKPAPSILPFLTAISAQPKFPLHPDPFCTNSLRFRWLCRRSLIVAFALLPSNPHFFSFLGHFPKLQPLFINVHAALSFKKLRVMDMDLSTHCVLTTTLQGKFG